MVKMIISVKLLALAEIVFNFFKLGLDSIKNIVISFKKSFYVVTYCGLT